MHIPDGFIDGTTSAGAAVVAAGGLGATMRRAGEVLDERRVPLAGLVAAFVFAVQMLNFPVATGTSGHLLGGALAAVLVGPAVGAVCVSVVLAVQALLFADGGLSALGLNILNMALVTAFGGYAVFVLARRVMSRTPSSVVLAAGIAAAVSVVLSAVAFTGTASVSTVAGAMVGVHVLIGIGEGVITALVVGAVLATRPDLVWGARNLAIDQPATASVAEGVAS
jgi:cobalt/nickel transport system permease protein